MYQSRSLNFYTSTPSLPRQRLAPGFGPRFYLTDSSRSGLYERLKRGRLGAALLGCWVKGADEASFAHPKGYLGTQHKLRSTQQSNPGNVLPADDLAQDHHNSQ
jgi:hypothetical protein